jgi:peptidoglycan hydrolase-like protein with peptidoglycan-binding domain
MIPFSSTIRRRGLRSFAFHPAGAVSLAPGSYDLTLEVTYESSLAPLASSAEFARLLRGIVGDATLFPGGGVSVVGDPVASSAGSTARASARLAFSRAINDDDAARAMARALYWSTTLSRTQDRATLGSEVPRNDFDGGSSITSALRGAPRFPVSRAIFRQAAVGAPTPSTPSTPSAPAVSFTGRPESQLSRGEITRYQQMLVALGHDVGRSGPDGVIGSGTRSAVQAFQRAQGISGPGQAGYGTLGPQTQAALERARPGTPPASTGSTPTRPSPTPSTPAPPTTPGTPTTPAPPRPQQASMSTGTVVAVSLFAAAVGAGFAFRDKLFPAPRRPPLARRRGASR